MCDRAARAVWCSGSRLAFYGSILEPLYLEIVATLRAQIDKDFSRFISEDTVDIDLAPLLETALSKY